MPSKKDLLLLPIMHKLSALLPLIPLPFLPLSFPTPSPASLPSSFPLPHSQCCMQYNNLYVCKLGNLRVFRFSSRTIFALFSQLSKQSSRKQKIARREIYFQIDAMVLERVVVGANEQFIWKPTDSVGYLLQGEGGMR